jgi:hypothetical protein
MISFLFQVGATDVLANVQSLLFQGLIYGLIPILMIFATLIRYSRKYFFEKQQKFTFKFAGEQWWMFYAITRYMSTVVAVLVGLVLLWPGLYLNTSVVVPFQPLGFDFFLIGFTLMLIKGINEDDRLHNTIRRLMLAGTSVYLIGTIIFIVCPQQLPLAQGTLYNSLSTVWMQITNAINSQSNISLAIYSIWLNIIVLLACVLLVVYSAFFKGKEADEM